MTVIQPNKNNTKLTKLIFYMCLGLFALVWFEVRVYSESVNLQHELIVLSERADAERVSNAELKNDYYALMDQENLDKLAKQRGLIRDKNPKWVFASQY